MSKRLLQSALREITHSLGRYIAIFAIIAIGVGFFAGLKVTSPDMLRTVEDYYEKYNFYDFRLVSTMGFDKEELDAFLGAPECAAVEGAVSFDVMAKVGDHAGLVLKAHSLTESVNQVCLKSGRLPENDSECLLDAYKFSEEMVGEKILLSEENEEDTLENFTHKEYTIVGLVASPIYIQYERGNTSLGNGVVDAFVILPEDAFAVDYFTEIDIKLKQNFSLYDEAYDLYIDDVKEAYENLGQKKADVRVERFNKEIQDAKDEVADAKAKIEDAKKQIEEAKEQIALLEETRAQLTEAAELLRPYKEAGYPLTPDQEAIFTALEELPEAPEFPEIPELPEEAKEVEELEFYDMPDVYVLGRDTNIGYVCYESDSGIVDGIANVFPIFFFSVAALVVITTMSRMVEEQRTQTGVLKALGYGDGAILFKYLFYSGSAALLGAVGGFLGGTWIFPEAIWYAYKMMYDAGELSHVFSWPLAIFCLVLSMLCSVGVTFVSCRVQLLERPAMLMRPRAPKAGKRILLERIGIFWNHLSFLRKVSLRNIFRYKRRFFMMILGISGCTALLIAGFGIKDSIADVANMQFDRISLYDMSVTLKDSCEAEENPFTAWEYGTKDYYLLAEESMELVTAEGTKSLYVVTAKDDSFTKFYDFHTTKGEAVAFPGQGEAVLNARMAELFHINIGDTITLRDGDLKECSVVVSGINENFINNYIYLSDETYREGFHRDPEKKMAYLNVHEGEDVMEVSAQLLESEKIAAVSVNEETRNRVEAMMKSMNIIVYIVIVCALALAFVVLYNLTNINITERIREIATIKVLGFFHAETCAYVFRENILLSVIGAFVGIPLGKILHAFIISRITVDLITFAVYVKPISYLYAFFATVIFAIFVNLFMGGKLDKVNMTESLKSVD